MARTHQVCIRLVPAWVKVADRLADRLGETGPVRPSRTAVMRAALERGLAAMRLELLGEQDNISEW